MRARRGKRTWTWRESRGRGLRCSYPVCKPFAKHTNGRRPWRNGTFWDRISSASRWVQWTSGQTAKPPPFQHCEDVHKLECCFSCGFDIEEGHTSQTCPAHWHKMNHLEGFTCKNSRQWINAGYDPCTKGMHKSQFPSF